MISGWSVDHRPNLYGSKLAYLIQFRVAGLIPEIPE